MNWSDLYHVLQVDPEADPDVIRAAHRVLAAKHHPDIGGSDEYMAAINVAWTTLSDPVARAEYDHQRRLRDGGDRWDAYGKAARAAARGSGTIIDFGRYAGWSIPEIAEHDPDYLEWLARSPMGRRHEHEIQIVLGHATAGSIRIDPMVRASEHLRRH
jgi:curved DNA-binding protein CbpA